MSKMISAKNIKLMTWFNFFTDFRLFSPIAIIYFSQVSGSFALGMSIFSVTMISAAFFEIPTGVISDHIGRKKTMIFGALFSIFSILFYAVGNAYYFLVVGALLEGLSRALYSGNNEAFLYDTLKQDSKENEYHEHFGKTSSMFQLAGAIAAIVGSLAALHSLSLAVWLSIIPQIICFFIGLRFVEPRIHSEKSGNIYNHLNEAFQNFRKNKKLRLLSIHSIIGFGVGEAKFQFQSAFFGMLWPVWAISLLGTINHAFAFVSYWFSGKIMNRFKAINIIIVHNLYGRVINIFSAVLPTVFSPLLISTASLGFGVSDTAMGTLLQKEFTDKQRATMGSLNSFAGSLFFGFIAICLGYVADKFTPACGIILSQILLLILIPIQWKLFHIDRHN